VAVTATPLTTGSSTTNTATYTTASIAPTPGRLVLAAVLPTVGSGTVDITLSGCGLNWVKVDQTTDAARTVHLFRAMGTPTAGPLTITGGSQMTSALWQVSEFGGTDTTGTDGSGAILQSVNARPGSATLVNVSFPSAVSTANSVYGAVGVAVQEAPAVGGAPWASMGATTQNAPTSGLLGEFAVTALQEVTASWTTAAASFVVGVEIKAAAGVATPTGAAGGSVAIVGSAVGQSDRTGSATGTVAVVGEAVGGNAPTGSATGTVAVVGTADGVSDRSGTTSGTVATLGRAFGTRPSTGTAAGTVAVVGSAVGDTPIVVATSHTYGYATLTSSPVSGAALVATPPGLATLTATPIPPLTVGGFGLDFGSSFGGPTTLAEATTVGAANGVGGAVLTDSTGRAVLQT